MRFNRQILTVAILALFVAQVLGGQALHLWQSSVGPGSRGSDGDCYINGHQSPRPVHGHAYSHCHHHVDGEQQQGESSPGKNQRHDSSKCRVCQILGQAQEQPIAFAVTTSAAVTPVSPAVAFEFYPSPSRSGFQARAPPAV
jgi:hypothetical protein